MSYQDGGADLRTFCRVCLEGKVTFAKSLLLRAAMAEARTVSDPGGNAKLAKRGEGGRRSRARDDASGDGYLAVAEGARYGDRPRRRWR